MSSFWGTLGRGIYSGGQFGPLGALGMAFGPSLFGGLLGRNDPNEKARRDFMSLMSPQHIEELTKNFWNQNINGPGFALASRAANAGSSNLARQVGNSFASRGILGSGVGAMGMGMSRSSLGNQMSNLYAGVDQQSRQQGFDLARNQAMGLAQMPMTPNYTANLFAGGLQSLIPFLMNREQQYPRFRF